MTRDRCRGQIIVALFTATSFLTASLLFLVQPMVARMVLPAFGGAPQVWTTSMLFFQAALLTGYGYTHIATHRVPRRRQPVIHLLIALLPLAALPISLAVTPSGRSGLAPSLELLAGLTIGVAAPFVLVATSGPLVQRWFSWTDHPRAHDPYFLYAAGNIGSAVGLLAYPFLLEPALTIEQQSLLWAGGYVLALLLLAACAFVVRRSHAPVESDAATTEVGAAQSSSLTLPLRRALRWVGLAFLPSSLMLAATMALSTDVAAVPLLWVAPLGTYLLSFSIAFSRAGPIAHRVAVVAAPAVIIGALAIRPLAFGVLPAIVLQILLVLVGGLVAHGQLARDRPNPALLTRFYLLLAVGGALGGLFNSLLAPLLFPVILEYGLIAFLTLSLVIDWRRLVPGEQAWPPFVRLSAVLVLVAIPTALLLLGRVGLADGLPPLLRAAGVLLLLIALATPWARGGAVGLTAASVALLVPIAPLLNAQSVERTFFGVHRVAEVGDGLLGLFHGTTLHGRQDLSSPATRREAISYYHADQPFGEVYELAANGADARVGVLGLGAGEIAAHGNAGQTLVFHEIDPAVVRIAEEQFTYLEDTPAAVEIVLGDGRLTLSDVVTPYDLLVVDAFTSDAVPVHLLTIEAIADYVDVVQPDGVIAVHISNRYLDLAPVLAGAARGLGIDGVITRGDGSPEHATPSIWVALSPQPGRLDGLRSAGWDELPDDARRWTDQRSSLFAVRR